MPEPFDLLIVGAGTAGLPCAIAAAEHGARVLVIDKAAEIGGTLHVSAGHMSGGGTARQRARGITDSPEAHFEDVTRISHGTAEGELVRLAVEEAPRTLDWLDGLGFPWVEDTPKIIYGHEAYSVPRTVWGVDGAKSILETLRPLWDERVRRGAIEVRLEHTLSDLIVERGAVTGVKAETQGETVELFADAVVLTTGGYGSNPEFFFQVTNGARLVSTAAPTSTGEGIHVAERHGAHFHNAGLMVPSLGAVELSPHRCDYARAWADFATGTYRTWRGEIFVNAAGERFLAEDEPSAHKRELAVLAQTEQKFWTVFDERALREGDRMVRQWSRDELKAKAEDERFLWRADSIGKLAERIGVDGERLGRTVHSFNQTVINGTPDPLGRKQLSDTISEAPFYALLTHGGTLITFGGLRVNKDLQVLTETGKPVPKLYAAGEILGAGATCGASFCGGMMVTPCLSFGRVLGRRLAAKRGVL